MGGAMVHLTTLMTVVVFGVLIAGLWNMSRQATSPSLSQKLMRWRVGLQFAAIVIAMLALALIKR